MLPRRLQNTLRRPYPHLPLSIPLMKRIKPGWPDPGSLYQTTDIQGPSHRPEYPIWLQCYAISHTKTACELSHLTIRQFFKRFERPGRGSALIGPAPILRRRTYNITPAPSIGPTTSRSPRKTDGQNMAQTGENCKENVWDPPDRIQPLLSAVLNTYSTSSRDHKRRRHRS